MRQNRLVQFARYTRYTRQSAPYRMPLRLGCNTIKLPWISNGVLARSLCRREQDVHMRISYADLIISLFWSQYRPLTLFHDLQNNWNKKKSNAHKNFEHALYKISSTDTNETHHLNYLLKMQRKNIPQFGFLNIPISMHLMQHLNEEFTHFFPIKNTNILYKELFNDFFIEKQATSVKRKRRLKMNKHKFKKRRDRQRALRRRIGK
ncbi:hypothetical protein PMAC_001892 [Pneumocystis sp. 'macacae']|nr:hypothetical protein PMAC_001892 [Pneumocystis sp. 'macacae']